MKKLTTFMALAAAGLMTVHAQKEKPPIQAEEPPPAAEVEIDTKEIEKRVEEIVNAVVPKAEDIARTVERVVTQVGKQIENFNWDGVALAQAHPPRKSNHPHGEDEHDEEGQAFLSLLGGGGKPQQSRAIVVRTSEADEKSADALQEDITVMARILEKNVEGGKRGQDAFSGWALQGMMGRPVRNLYVEGHGVIFMQEAGFPLIAPMRAQEPKEKKEETSSAWEEAKRELYGPGRPGRPIFTFDGNKAAPFSEERVEQLRNRTIEALRNATHMKSLKSEDYVTVVLMGPRAADGHTAELEVLDAGGNEDKPTVRVERRQVVARNVNRSREGSTMTIRARKADIDSFAQDKISLEDFRKKVKVAAY
jgi:hypothetical protein